jgi:hypothetical protein
LGVFPEPYINPQVNAAHPGETFHGTIEHGDDLDQLKERIIGRFGDIEFQTVSEYVNERISDAVAQIEASIPAPTPAPALEFRTEFMNTQWNDLSTCWILLNVCHIELNMIRAGLTTAETINGYPIGILKIGMPVPSEDVEAQLAGLSGILTLRLKHDGIIYISEIIQADSQINVSIFYTFTEYLYQYQPPPPPIEPDAR